MAELALIYREDTATGLPTLEDPEGVLSAEQLLRLRKVVDQHYESLAGGDGQIATLHDLAETDLPQRWEVAVRRESGVRCLRLELRAVGPWPAEPSQNPTSATARYPTGGSFNHRVSFGPAETSQDVNGSAAGSGQEGTHQGKFGQSHPASWQLRLVEDLEEQCRVRCRTLAEYRRLQPVFEEIRGLAAEHPEKLSAVLLVGYLHVAEGISSQSEPASTPRYLDPTEVLARILGSELPEGAFRGLPGAQPTRRKPTTIQWTSQLLRRVFGRNSSRGG